ncbi:unnamed protein product, partial [Ixodes pacificus]
FFLGGGFFLFSPPFVFVFCSLIRTRKRTTGNWEKAAVTNQTRSQQSTLTQDVVQRKSSSIWGRGGGYQFSAIKRDVEVPCESQRRLRSRCRGTKKQKRKVLLSSSAEAGSRLAADDGGEGADTVAKS